MNVLSISEFRRETGKSLLELAPIKLLSEGEPVGFFGKIEDFVYIGDFHPRVKIQFKAKEQLIRQGMPHSDFRVSYEEAKKETEQES